MFDGAIVLQPYCREDFEDQISGVTLDAFSAGAPVIATAGTWMARAARVSAPGGARRPFPGLDPVRRGGGARRLPAVPPERARGGMDLREEHERPAASRDSPVDGREDAVSDPHAAPSSPPSSSPSTRGGTSRMSRVAPVGRRDRGRGLRELRRDAGDRPPVHGQGLQRPVERVRPAEAGGGRTCQPRRGAERRLRRAGDARNWRRRSGGSFPFPGMAARVHGSAPDVPGREGDPALRVVPGPHDPSLRPDAGRAFRRTSSTSGWRFPGETAPA